LMQVPPSELLNESGAQPRAGEGLGKRSSALAGAMTMAS